MFARYEKRSVFLKEKIWTTKWLNLNNSPHWHDEIEIVYCESGKCVITLEDETITLLPNECAFIESFASHSIKSFNDTVVITILIDNDFISSITQNYQLKQRKLIYTHDINYFYTKVYNELEKKDLFYSISLNSLVFQLVVEIFRKERITNYVSKEINPKVQLAKDIVKEIEKNFLFITFNDVCKKFSYSPAHFSRLFNKLFSVSFSEYLSAIKIEHAIELIHSNKKISITEIAIKSGFQTIRNFNRCFLKFTGYTPSTLPKDFTFSRSSIKILTDPFDPTGKNSIILN